MTVIALQPIKGIVMVHVSSVAKNHITILVLKYVFANQDIRLNQRPNKVIV